MGPPSTKPLSCRQTRKVSAMTTHEQILQEKAEKAQTAEDLIAIAQEEGIELSPEDAESYLETRLKQGEVQELSEAELANATGGARHNGHLIVTAFMYCDYFEWTPTGELKCCLACKYCYYKFPFWLCSRR